MALKTLIDYGACRNEEAAKDAKARIKKEHGRSAHVRIQKKNLRLAGFSLPMVFMVAWKEE